MRAIYSGCVDYCSHACHIPLVSLFFSFAVHMCKLMFACTQFIAGVCSHACHIPLVSVLVSFSCTGATTTPAFSRITTRYHKSSLMSRRNCCFIGHGCKTSGSMVMGTRFSQQRICARLLSGFFGNFVAFLPRRTVVNEVIFPAL